MRYVKTTIGYTLFTAAFTALFATVSIAATPHSTNRARSAAAASLALLKLRHEHEKTPFTPIKPEERRGTGRIEIRVPDPIALQPVKRAKYLTRLMVFGTKSCKPCRDQDGTILTLEQSGTGWFRGPDDTYPIQMVDVHKQPDLTAEWNVELWPTTIAIVNGRERRRRVGYISSHVELSQMLKDDSPPAAPIKPNSQPPRMRVEMNVEQPFRGRELLPKLRNADNMRRHLVEDHGYTSSNLNGLDYETLRRLHDNTHGEQLR